MTSKGPPKKSAKVQAVAGALDLDPQDHFLVGREFYLLNNLEQASQEFHLALQLDANHFWTHYFIGLCFVTSGKPEVAVHHLTLCQNQQPDLVWVYLLRGFALGQMKNHTAAEADFDSALALAPSKATQYVLYSNRGVMRMLQEGEEAWAKGVEDLKKAALLDKDQYQASASLSAAYQLRNQLGEAGKYLDEAIVIAGRQVGDGLLAPETLARLHHSRAKLRLQRQDQDACACADFAAAARLAANDLPLRARAEADRGRVLQLQKHLPEALAAYAAALAADPGRVEVLRWRGQALFAQRLYPEAAAAFDAYVARETAPVPAVYRMRGQARAKSGRHPEAIDDFGRALDAQRKDAEALRAGRGHGPDGRPTPFLAAGLERR